MGMDRTDWIEYGDGGGCGGRLGNSRSAHPARAYCYSRRLRDVL